MRPYCIPYSKTLFPLSGSASSAKTTSEEDQMYQQDTTPVAPTQAAAQAVPEFYLPLGGGTDPDFNLPADREHVQGRFSRWIHALPSFGRRQP
jgi:hypothetical protein